MRRRIVHLEDDLNGKPAEETVTFGLDGRLYELDLTGANAAKLRKALDQYVSAGRRVGYPQTSASRGSGARRTARGRSKGDLAAIREWATANGYEVGSRGRIPEDVRKAYELA